ncbi:sensor domain-containing diguanylate cyclase [Tsukamurella soli]|uniref:PAS domain S-box-containing protein/diguanylate cyclase (GGDEF) domain-containing protein n=1 Tax=Tsukamurella soli TaxID=644556 RepID=A0ABP8JSA4_9ACTN
MTGGQPPAPQFDPEATALAWAMAVTETGYTGTGVSGHLEPLRLLLTVLHEQWHANAPDVDRIAAVGKELVARGCTTPEALARTLDVISHAFGARCDCAPRPGPAAPARLAVVLSGVATGFTQALRDRILAEQSDIHAAVDAARRRAVSAYHLSEDRFRTVFTQSPIGIVITDDGGVVTDSNPAAEVMFGFAAPGLRGQAVARFFVDTRHTRDGAVPGADTDSAAVADGEHELRAEDGRTWWADVLVREVDSPAADGHHMYLLTDVTEARHRRQRLEYEATHDTLTGLANRAHAYRHLKQAVAAESHQRGRGAVVHLLYVDLDDFKRINDTHGHRVGDRILQVTADRLRAITGAEDIVARIGGDEFLIITTTDRLDSLARRVDEVLHEPVDIDGAELRVAASTGTTVGHPSDSRDIESMLHTADLAMYATKRRRRGGTQPRT